MKVVDLLSALAERDIQLWLDQGNLRFSAPEGAFTDSLRQQVVANKPDIIEFLAQATKKAAAPIPILERSNNPLALSYGQQRLWLVDQLVPNDITYNMTSALTITGPLQLPLLTQALTELVSRHESLRTAFGDQEGVPFQRIQPPEEWRPEIIDLNAESEQQRQTTVEQAFRSVAESVYDLAAGYLFQVKLLRLEQNQHVLVAGMHHIVSDAWSMEILVRELGILYLAAVRGISSSLPPLPVQYADYAQWQRDQMASEGMKEQLNYWVDQLADAPPVLGLPTDRPRSEAPSKNGALMTAAVASTLSAQVESCCKEQDITPYMCFLAGWVLLLSRYADTKDVVLAAPISGRNHPDLDGLIGFFVNMLLLRFKLPEQQSTAGWLQLVKQQVLDGFNHQDLPVDQLLDALSLEPQPGYPPVAEVAFQLLNLEEQGQESPFAEAELSFTPIEMEQMSARMDMVLGVSKKGSRYELSLEYNTDLFHAKTIKRLLEHYQRIMTQLTTANAQSLDQIELYTQQEFLAQWKINEEQNRLIPLRTGQLYYCSLPASDQTCHNSQQWINCEEELDQQRLQSALEQVLLGQPEVATQLIQSRLPGAQPWWGLAPVKPGVQINYPSTDVVLHDKLISLAPSQSAVDAVAFYCQSTVSGFRLELIAHPAALDGAASASLLTKVIQRYGQCQGSANDVRQGQSISQQNASEQAKQSWREALRQSAPLSFSWSPDWASSTPSQGDSKARSQVERWLDAEEITRIASFCQQHGISTLDYWRGLFAFMLRHYCYPDEGFLVFNSDCLASSSHEAKGSEAFCSLYDSQLWCTDNSIAGWLDGGVNCDEVSLEVVSKHFQDWPLVPWFSAWDLAPVIRQQGVQRGAFATDQQLKLQVTSYADAVQLQLAFNSGVFNGLDFLPRMLDLHQQLLGQGAVAASQLHLLSSAEQNQLQQWGTGEPLTASATLEQNLNQRLETIASQAADQVAIIANNVEWTYSQLHQKANQLANGMLAHGLRPGDRVAIGSGATPEFVMAVLACIKIGAVYVPLDPTFPSDRLQFMVEDCAAKLVLVVDAVQSKFSSLTTAEQWSLDRTNADWLAQSESSPKLDIPAAAGIYAVYTSGSTGQPKAAMVTRKAVENLQQWYLHTLQLTASDRTLLMSAIGFDLTQKNVLAPLLVGAGILLPESEVYDADALLQAVENYQISWINCAPSAFYPLVELAQEQAYGPLRSLKWLVLGGEAIRAAALRDWLSGSSCQCQLINSYGPTECTDVVIAHQVTSDNLDSSAIPLGKPIPSAQISILDAEGKAVIPGVVGEIVISGLPVGLGYINREELNAQLFFDHQPLGRSYKTGDLGRFLPDGTLEYMGRKDFQVKIRGMRVELGEVEQCLRQQPEIDDALALVKADKLVAYVVSPQSETESQLVAAWTASLEHQLPVHMVPQGIVILRQWPLTPNGKIDRRGLPEPQFHQISSGAMVAPRNDIEETLLDIWQQVLAVASISVTADLFKLGGNSIAATQIIARARNHWKISLSVRDLMVEPTIAGLANAVNRAVGRKGLPAIEPVDRQSPLPLSFVQQQLWLLDQLDPGTPAYNMPIAVKIRGPLDQSRFEKALNQVISRHETLRSNFVAMDGMPQVVIHPQRPLSLSVEDLTTQQEEVKKHIIQQQVTEQSKTGFELANDGLLRGKLLKIKGDPEPEFLFVGAMHHMVSDGWSMDLLLMEVLEFYSADIEQRSPRLPKLAVQYVDLAAWQRQWLQGEALAQHLEYWGSQLQNEGAVLDLVTDYPRPKVLTTHGAAHETKLSAELVSQARALADESGATLFMVLVAVYQLLLAKMSGQQQINVGTPIAGREQVEAEPLIGFFINTVVISSHLDPSQSARQLLQAVRSTTFDAYAHQALPFEKIIAELKPPRDSSRTPFFQAFINFLNLPKPLNVDTGLSFENFVPEQPEIHSKYDFNLYISEQADAELSLLMVYNADLYRPETISNLMAGFSELFTQFVAQPDRALAQLSLSGLNSAPALTDASMPLAASKAAYISPLDRFFAQAEAQPKARALVFEQGEISYGELAKQSLQLAGALTAEHGVKPGDLVAIVASRSPNLIAAVLAVMKAGAVFTLIDTAYPIHRIQQMVSLAGAGLVLLTEGVEPASPIAEHLNVPLLSVTDLLAGETGNPVALSTAHDIEALSYIAFPSGTSGQPKAIESHFAPVTHFVDWYANEYEINENDRFGMFSGVSHDPLLRDIFVPLAVGAELHIPNGNWLLDPVATADWIREAELSFLHLTPSVATVLCEGSLDNEINSLRCIALGGEKLAKTLVEKIRVSFPQATLLNCYGATETPQIMALYQVPAALDELPAVIPVGQGIDQVQLLVVNAANQLCGQGEVGEIVIRTPYLARGYRHPQETNGFAANPFSQQPQDRVYFTGDKGRVTALGQVEVLGRLDQQIKIRGYRVEPAEIEAMLEAEPLLAATKVVAAKDPRDEDCLVAYLVASGQGLSEHNLAEQQLAQLRTLLRAKLPEYMVPALMIEMSELPLTANGKIDLHRLPDPANHWRKKAYVAPQTTMEQEIADIWQTVMKLDQISVDDNFFEIGGHSLLAVQIVTRVKEKYQVEFSMRRLLEQATIHGMAAYVENSLWLRSSQSAADVDDDLEEFEI